MPRPAVQGAGPRGGGPANTPVAYPFSAPLIRPFSIFS
jgi:hypothetical protein